MSVRYLALVSFTNEGVRHAANSTKRASEFEATVNAAGGKVLSQYWSMGEFDGAVTLEAPSETVAAGLLLQLAGQGFVRTRSMRVYDAKEFQAIIG